MKTNDLLADLTRMSQNSLFIEFNAHRLYGSDTPPDESMGWLSSKERQKARETGMTWTAIWHFDQDNYITISASNIDLVLRELMEVIKGVPDLNPLPSDIPTGHNVVRMVDFQKDK